MSSNRRYDCLKLVKSPATVVDASAFQPLQTTSFTALFQVFSEQLQSSDIWSTTHFLPFRYSHKRKIPWNNDKWSQKNRYYHDHELWCRSSFNHVLQTLQNVDEPWLIVILPWRSVLNTNSRNSWNVGCSLSAVAFVECVWWLLLLLLLLLLLCCWSSRLPLCLTKRRKAGRELCELKTILSR